MGINMLANYLSRSQIREYLSYILENGTDLIVESPDGVHVAEPLNIRIGSSINSINLFHIGRHEDNRTKLTQQRVVFSANDTKPSLSDEALVVGVIYMSKLGRDYSGDRDTLGKDSYNGDIGDVVWFDRASWDEFSLGKTVDGVNCRLFVFWKAA